MKAYIIDYNIIGESYFICEGREFVDSRRLTLNSAEITSILVYFSKAVPEDRKFEIIFGSDISEDKRKDITDRLQQKFSNFQKSSIYSPRKKR